MTPEEFVELQKKVYKPGKEWEDLFIQFNKKNKTNLNPQMRNGYVIILKAIAAKHGWEYKGNEYMKYKPFNEIG